MKTTNENWCDHLFKTLYVTLAPSMGSSKCAFEALMNETSIRHALCKQVWTPQHVCRESLATIEPLLNRLCEPPSEGWLTVIYRHLCAGLYPDSFAIHPESPAREMAVKCYLAVLRAAAAHEAELRPYDPFTDIRLLSKQEYEGSRIQDEYAAFIVAVEESFYIETMRIAREIMPFDPLSHTAGVHHVALHMARQAGLNGVPVDLALVSAAALSHDIGKFGCQNEDADRIPYLHYYFTNQWLQRYGLTQIAHIATNHSAWDLEFDNLPAESLMLIYADFRVRGARGEDGKERIRIHTLSKAKDIIFSKLAHMDEQKRNRYSRVYHKLNDFEDYLAHLSVNPDPMSDTPLPVSSQNAALQSDAEAVRTLSRMAVEYSLKLMHSVNTSASFERLLERARSEKNLQTIRTYLNLFDEYFTYMSRGHKLLLLNFLYELLMHSKSDVRRQAGKLMGRILANSGLQYRKELPEHAPQTAIAPSLSEILGQCASLWDAFLHLLIEPDTKISRVHAIRINNSLKVVVGSLFDSCVHADARMYLDVYLRWFTCDGQQARFFLCDSIPHVPAELFSSLELNILIDFCADMMRDSTQYIQVCALQALVYLAETRLDEVKNSLITLIGGQRFDDNSAAAYLVNKLQSIVDDGAVKMQTAFDPSIVSELYLDNLKSAVHWSVKVVNIDRLYEYATKATLFEAYHVATHLGNLLQISEHLPVRQRASAALMKLAPLLSVVQCNEIVIDLCRGLEAGRSEFSKYVPPCLSVLMGQLPAAELDEALTLLERMVRSSNEPAASAALETFGALLTAQVADNHEAHVSFQQRQDRILGILMAGLAHFNNTVHRTAFMVLCRDVFSAQDLPLPRRRALFMQINKKALTIIQDRVQRDINFFNTTAMLNHLYRMIIDCEVLCGEFHFPKLGAVAFFPGTFDPFSSGHKRIVTELQAMGVEVYLTIDEFSWSKRTQPKLLRRQIALMSVADCAGVYLFPDDISINLANPADLTRLKGLFPDRQLYIVAGSDVIENASAYANPDDENSACYLDHILFKRDRCEDDLDKPPALGRLRGQVVQLALPTFYETVSSTRIREAIDQNLEVSMLVDPIVAAYIQGNGLYLRSPQYKRTMRPSEQTVAILKESDVSTAHVLSGFPESFSDGLLRALRSGNGRAAVCIGENNALASSAIYGHTINASNLFEELGDAKLTEYVRTHTSGKILFLDGAAILKGAHIGIADLATELITNALSDDHTYALYRAKGDDDPLAEELCRSGFLSINDGVDRVLCVDMRAPIVITCDAFMMIKEPFASDPAVVACVLDSRQRLREALCGLFPGELVLSYDAAMINRELIRKVQRYNGVLGLPDKPRRLGPFMCVPYGKIMSDVVVPNTVTKALHAEKVFDSDIRHFTITEDRGYSPLANQLAAIRSFNRPVILVDDLLHNSYRLQKLAPLFKEAGIEIKKILVGVLSGRGRDIMAGQQQDVDTVYWVPNMRYWFTEALLYPFIGGDSVHSDNDAENALPSVNLILPYKSPTFLRNVSIKAKQTLFMTALSNTYEILHTLEQRHEEAYTRSLTLSRLGEVLLKPRMPDKGRHSTYDLSVPASAYVLDDIEWLSRIGGDVWN